MAKFVNRRFLDDMFELTSILAQGCVIEGNVSCSNTLLVGGKVIGNGKISGSLSIIDQGVWQGSIHCGDISVAGTVEGDIVSSRKIEVLDSAVVRGSITGGQIAVAKGAQIFGEMSVNDGSQVKIFEERRKKRD